jgi:hypothetical protein
MAPIDQGISERQQSLPYRQSRRYADIPDVTQALKDSALSFRHDRDRCGAEGVPWEAIGFCCRAAVSVTPSDRSTTLICYIIRPEALCLT